MGFVAPLEKWAETVALSKESERYVLSRGFCKDDQFAFMPSGS